ncbi:MAG: type I 3-dehydroquinate dehydratase [Akkermansia sp.]
MNPADKLFLDRFRAPAAPPLIISAVAGEQAWRAFVRAGGQHAACDAVELRLDTLPADIPLSAVASLRPDKPVLLTQRHESEGGAMPGLSPTERCARVRALLPLAAAADWEIARLEDEGVPELCAELREQGIALIASAHDFERTPALAELQTAAAHARRLGADCTKFAFTLRETADLLTGVELLRSQDTAATAAMGMGALGVVSRLLYSQLGSRLIYCSFAGAGALVPGQLPDALAAPLLAQLPRCGLAGNDSLC